MRKYPLVVDQTYHIFSRSIANFKIFNNQEDFQRMIKLFHYFQIQNLPTKFSYFISYKTTQSLGFFRSLDLLAEDNSKLVQIIAYCLMPTHIHLMLKQIQDNGISIFMNNVLNSYTRYFNTYHKRKGPLWEQRFKNVLVKNDEQLLHLTRYIHLNPVSASIVKNPEEWQFSSISEYIYTNNHKNLCNFDDLLKINHQEYKKFVNERINYQKELRIIKNLCLES